MPRQRKVDEVQRAEIRLQLWMGRALTYPQIAKRYNVSPATVRVIAIRSRRAEDRLQQLALADQVISDLFGHRQALIDALKEEAES